jgi:uncharacterized protein YceK
MNNESESSHEHIATRRASTVGRTPSALVVSIVVGLLVLSGCGSDSSKDAADPAASVASQQSATTDDSEVATAAPTVDIGVQSSVVTQTTPESSALPSTAPPTSTAAGDSSSSVAAGDAQDPCRLMSAAEAEAALGMAVQAAVTTAFDSQTYGHGSDCSYSTVDQAAGPTTVHVGVLGEGFPRELWEQEERAQPGVQEVPGLGDIAFFDETNETIDAFVGGRWVQAQMINTNESELLGDLTEIVRLAIERM